MLHKLKQQFHSLVVTYGAYAEYIKELNDRSDIFHPNQSPVFSFNMPTVCIVCRSKRHCVSGLTLTFLNAEQTSTHALSCIDNYLLKNITYAPNTINWAQIN